MAERRMFAKTIIDSDAFLDMPLSTQSLYFHLSMRADDDGFINNPKKIQRMIGASDDDLRLLVAKRFIIPFDSGIVVIKHWRIHNYIQKDRYKETVYKEEKALLTLKGNNTYTLDTGCIRDGYEMDTQVRLGKVRDKDKREVGEISAEISEEKTEISGDVSDVVELFHTICKSFPRVVRLSDPRKRAIRARMKAYSMEDFRKLFEAAEASSFLKGENDRGWRATFDWLMNEQNMTKVLEGAYADTGRRKRANRFANFEERPGDDIAEIERQLLGKEVRR